MKKLFFTAIIIAFSTICNAQQKEKDTVKFVPPVIVKDSETVTKFTLPVIRKNEPLKKTKSKSKNVKFVQPVITKDSIKTH